ncbi:hypothetical protein MRB53_020533 [Persea americana]|uniref:Uncharacterized protein n=1 Tax=Persea americana TaxID=3435 RepID=A0ACC2L1G1_PERAE|nr:hypothetical protein MRB53_020533 [Persea americana]
MRSRGHTVSAIHGHMDQSARDIVQHEFHSGSSRVLITTDRYARGIDIPQFSVVNYDMPVEVENYLHRIRCGGRFSRKGVVISFVICEGGRDLKMLGDIQVFTGVVIERMPSKMADFHATSAMSFPLYYTTTTLQSCSGLSTRSHLIFS